MEFRNAELKSYQERVLSDLKEFLEYVEVFPDVKIAFREYWQHKGLARPLAYTNTGRVLRQPYAMTHIAPVLNTSYVFASSTNFQNTLAEIVQGLNRTGFSTQDYREKDFSMEEPELAVVPPADRTILPRLRHSGSVRTRYRVGRAGHCRCRG